VINETQQPVANADRDNMTEAAAFTINATRKRKAKPTWIRTQQQRMHSSSNKSHLCRRRSRLRLAGEHARQLLLVRARECMRRPAERL
jgi:hypothetical protein